MDQVSKDTTRMLRRIQSSLDAAIDVFDGILSDARDGGTVRDTETRDAIRTLTRLQGHLFDVVGKYEEEKATNGAGSKTPDEIRSEIRRALDRIRTAGEADGVRERSE